VSPRRPASAAPSDGVAESLRAFAELAESTPRAGDTVRVILPSGRIVRRRVTGHVTLGAMSLEVNGHVYGSSQLAVKLVVKGYREPLSAHRDVHGWYVEAEARDA
jgi:hypothetical protein